MKLLEVRTPVGGLSVTWGDVNDDGRQDLAVTANVLGREHSLGSVTVDPAELFRWALNGFKDAA